MKAETVVITPELAKKWLAKNPRNRPLDRKRVAVYASDMTAGRWKLNGETIKFNGDAMIDGQHRLQACVTSGVPFVSFVIHDVDGDVFDTIDRGKSRTAGDIFHLMGEKNSRVIASGLAVIHKYILGIGFSNSGAENAATIGRLEELLNEYPEVRECATLITGLGFLKKVCSTGLSCGLATLMYRKHPELARAFWRDVNDGTNTFQPAAKLRERLIANSLSKQKFATNDIGTMIIKAWNAVVDGTEIRQLKALRTEGENAETRPLIK
jgi:hypothetical protein